MSAQVISNETGSPPGTLADAEGIVDADAGPLSGVTRVGVTVWERRVRGST